MLGHRRVTVRTKFRPQTLTTVRLQAFAYYIIAPSIVVSNPIGLISMAQGFQKTSEILERPRRNL